jgi:hypothetical protein
LTLRGVLFLLLCAVCASGALVLSHAQSGRKRPEPRSTVPAPTPTPDPSSSASGVSDSDERRKPKTDPSGAPLFSFYVLEDENTDLFLNLPSSTHTLVMNSFITRLQDSPNVSVAAGGKSDRKRAHDHAKIERDAFTVLVQLDAETTGGRPPTTGRPTDLGSLVVRYYVYAPTTATLKLQGQVYMRPYQASARVGGVRVPLPTPRTNRLPVEYAFEQAGREAAERIMSALDIHIPPERR